MDCEQAQEIILTGYLDGEISEEVRGVVDRHLSGCPACRDFLSVASRVTADPFRDLPRAKMPERVFCAIMDNIREGEAVRPQSWGSRFLEGLREWRPSFVPSYGWAALLFCCILAGTQFHKNSLEVARQSDRSRFLAEVTDLSSASNRSAGNYGTAIETYFLQEGDLS